MFVHFDNGARYAMEAANIDRIGKRLIASWYSEVIKYKGICDGSAGIALGKKHFLTASDEDSNFYLYHCEKPERTIQTKCYSSLLAREDRTKEADIEASAKIGDITYWIGSHSRDSKGKWSPERHQLFAARISRFQDNIMCERIGHSYTNLLYDMLQDSSLAALGLEHPKDLLNPKLACKTKRGLNIEGLAQWHSDQLLIGFRNPRVNGNALLVPLKNPLKVVRGEEHPVFGSPVYLALGNRGIRDIQYWPQQDIYLIIAGSYDTTDDFSIFCWSGKRRDQPIELTDLGMQNFHAECIVTFEDYSDRFLILTDEGGTLVNGIQRKFSDDKYFYGRWARLEIWPPR